MARLNLQIKVGKYTGNATDSTNITGIGFRPDVVIIKGAGNNAVFRVRNFRGDSTGFLASGNTGLTDRIQEILNDGFQIGTAAQVNSNAVIYYYIALRGAAAQQYLNTFNYVGDGNDSRNVTATGISFTPDFVTIQAITGSTQSVFKTSTMAGDTSVRFEAVAGAANQIQNLQSNGFQLGTSSLTNTSAVEYAGFALKALPGAIAVGTFTGSGIAQSITGLGFTPDFVMVKNYTTTDCGRLLTSTMVTDALASNYFNTTAAAAQGITSLDADGFTVGTDASVNGNTNAIHWVAFKSGNFKTPLSRLAS